jgi:hypothetical protein
MAAQTVSGASPITFISEDTTDQTVGIQHQIPLPLISYDGTTTPPTVNVSAGLSATDQKLAVAVIQNMINLGLLTPHS